MTAPVQPPKFGPGDEALSQLPTVYRDNLFAGKVVLVSGAGSGIGKAIAFLFARLGPGWEPHWTANVNLR